MSLSPAVMIFAPTPGPAIHRAGGCSRSVAGEAGHPVLVAAVRKYSTTAQRSISPRFLPMVNVGRLSLPFLLDWVLKGSGASGHLCARPLLNTSLTTYRCLVSLVSFHPWGAHPHPLLWLHAPRRGGVTDDGQPESSFRWRREEGRALKVSGDAFEIAVIGSAEGRLSASS